MKKMNIEELIEKYFEGETSVEEEKYIVQYFQNGNIEKKLLPYKPLFTYINILKKQDKVSKNSINNLSLIDSLLVVKKFNKGTKYFLSGIAATIVIFIVLFNMFNTKTQLTQNIEKPKQVIENKISNSVLTDNINSKPQEKKVLHKRKAIYKHRIESKKEEVKNNYDLAVNTLLFVSETLNSGLKDFKKVSNFNKGIDDASKLSNMEKYQKNLIKFINN